MRVGLEDGAVPQFPFFVTDEEESAYLAAQMLDRQVGCVIVNLKAYPARVIADNGIWMGGSLVE